MKAKHWVVAATVCTVALIALTGAILLSRDAEKRSLEAASTESARETMHPIEMEIVERLGKETLADSLANLTQSQEFAFPASSLTSNMIVFSPDLEPWGTIANDDWIRVLNNRRVLKLLEELGKLPKEEAGRMVSEQIRTNLEAYRRGMAKREASLKAMRETPEIFLAKPHRSDDPVDEADKPGVDVASLSVKALLFIGGALGLPSVSDAVREVTRLALKQRDKCYSLGTPNGSLEYQDAFSDMTRLGFYNPSILATAIRGTGMAGEHALDVIAPRKSQWVEEDLTSWKSPHA